jgi:hypothetical protein
MKVITSFEFILQHKLAVKNCNGVYPIIINVLCICNNWVLCVGDSPEGPLKQLGKSRLKPAKNQS